MRRFFNFALAVATATALTASASDVAHAQQRGDATDPFATRDQWQRAADMIAALGDMRGKRVADIAAGSGFMTRPLAKAVGPTGRVYAVEIDAAARATLAALARADSLHNIEVIEGGERDLHVPVVIDGIVVLNAYHEFTDYRSMLAALLRVLRPGGRLVMVDNAAIAGRFTERADQAAHHAIDPRFVDAELREAGFEIVDRQDRFITTPFAQWMIVARKPDV